MFLSKLLENNYAIDQHELYESTGWTIGSSSFYRKMLKKYRGDKRVQAALKELLDFIQQYEKTPAIRDYPQEFNVHALRPDPKFPEKSLGAHLKGQKIVLVFSVDGANKTIDLYGIGTHQMMGWN